MNCFDNIEFEKGIITVLGISADAPLVSELKRKLEKAGSVKLVTEKVFSTDADYIISVPDRPVGHEYIFHSAEDMVVYSARGKVIGYISVDIIEKEIKNVVKGAEDFCSFSDLYTDELMFPRALGRAISEREKYDLIFIGDVCGEGKRYFARDINRYITYGAGVRMLNTDSDYAEELQKSSI